MTTPTPPKTKTTDVLPLTKLMGMHHPKNPKKHNLPKIVGSYVRNGFVGFITVDSNTMVIARGHGRTKALNQMRESGDAAPVGIVVKKGEWFVPVEYKAFATIDDRDAFVVADNKAQEDEYDEDLLAEMVNDLDDTSGTGLDDDELAAMLDDDDPSLDDRSGSGGSTVEVEGHTRQIGATPSPQHKVLPPRQMTNADWSVHLGDCLEWLRSLADNSVDAIVTDPPSGIAFMGEDWDKDKGGRDKWIAWLESIMVECLRVLKPGGHGFVWSFARTSHWTAFALENSGLEIRDRAAWIYLNGFPKYLNVSKAIDAKLGRPRAVVGQQTIPGAQMQEMSNLGGSGQAWTGEITSNEPNTAAAAYKGYATALKPAIEDWWLVRKPLDGTVAETAMKWGTGGLNIDACRIGDEATRTLRAGHSGDNGVYGADAREGVFEHSAPGRYPPHLIVGDGVEINDIDNPALYFYCPKPGRAETEAGLDDLPVTTGGEATKRADGSKGVENPRAGAGRGGGRRNTHKTKKPLDLMRWLIRLVAPPTRDGVAPLIIDPFTGSGTTGMAALVEGCRFAGAELVEKHHLIATTRLRSIIEDPRRIDSADDDEDLADDDNEDDAPDDGTATGMMTSTIGDQVYVSPDGTTDES